MPNKPKSFIETFTRKLNRREENHAKELVQRAVPLHPESNNNNVASKKIERDKK